MKLKPDKRKDKENIKRKHAEKYKILASPSSSSPGLKKNKILPLAPASPSASSFSNVSSKSFPQSTPVPEPLPQINQINLADFAVEYDPTAPSLEYDPTAPSLETNGPRYKQVSESKTEFLLSYTFFLEKFAKFIAVGYSGITLRPIVFLFAHNNEILLNSYEWYTIISYKNIIEKVFDGEIIKIPVFISEDIFLKSNFSNEIVICKSENTFEVNKFDWESILHLAELIKSILHLYLKTQDSVREYYNRYTQLCFEKNVMSLTSDNFFVLSENPYKCNFTRLFYELGVMLKQKCIKGGIQ